VFRTSQKHIERELGAVQTMVADLMAKGGPLDDKALDAMIARITSLKRKVRPSVIMVSSLFMLS
jgi:uncharacterized membrane protein YqhA